MYFMETPCYSKRRVFYRDVNMIQRALVYVKIVAVIKYIYIYVLTVISRWFCHQVKGSQNGCLYATCDGCLNYVTANVTESF